MTPEIHTSCTHEESRPIDRLKKEQGQGHIVAVKNCRFTFTMCEMSFRLLGVCHCICTTAKGSVENKDCITEEQRSRTLGFVRKRQEHTVPGRKNVEGAI